MWGCAAFKSKPPVPAGNAGQTVEAASGGDTGDSRDSSREAGPGEKPPEHPSPHADLPVRSHGPDSLASQATTVKVKSPPKQAVRNSDPLIMENADKLEGFRSRGEYILTGNVRFRHGELRFETQRAVWSKEINQVYCEQGMHIMHRGSDLTAERGNYDKASNEAEAEGKVQLRDSTGDLRGKGDKLVYHRLSHEVTFLGHPELRRLYRDTAQKENDTLPVTDTLILQGKRMTYNDSSRIALAETSVVITRRKTRITCARAEYRDKADSLFLSGDPKVVVDRSQIEGEKMRIRLNEEEIRGLLVQGKAKAHSIDVATDSTPERQSEIEGDSLLLAFSGKQIDSAQVFHDAHGNYYDTDKPKLRNRMRGEKMVMRFKNREVRSAQVVGGAKSTYFHLENGRLKGRNVAEGDTIRFAFAEGEIDEVLVSGKARGVYYGKANRRDEDSTTAPGKGALEEDIQE